MKFSCQLIIGVDTNGVGVVGVIAFRQCLEEGVIVGIFIFVDATGLPMPMILSLPKLPLVHTLQLLMLMREEHLPNPIELLLRKITDIPSILVAHAEKPGPSFPLPSAEGPEPPLAIKGLAGELAEHLALSMRLRVIILVFHDLPGVLAKPEF